VSTYRDVFRRAEFRNLWISNAITNAAATMTSLTLATLVHEQTGSALLSALIMFGPLLAQMLGATTLMSAADTARPRPILVVLAVVSAVSAGAQAAVDMPPWARLLITLAVAYCLSIGAGVRWGLLSDVLPHEDFVLGRSAMNLSVGAMQILGFGLAGVLLQVLDPAQVFWLAAFLSVAAVPALRFGLSNRPPRRTARTSLRETWRGNRRLLAHADTRVLIAALSVPNGLIVGCEALFVPYAGESAGLLFVAGAAGMMTGDLVVGRVLGASRRRRWNPAMRFLLAVPFLPFLLTLPLWLAAAFVALGSVGYAASLAQQEMLVAVTPPELRGQVLGLESALRMTMFGVCAVLAGAVADLWTPGWTMTACAVASVVASAVLVRPLSRVSRSALRAADRELVDA
jgi:predicted MFS family arabinose efflux permease